MSLAHDLAGARRTVPAVDERRLGMAAGLGAYALWGLFPLYFPLLEPAGGLEIVAHRVLWSLLFIALLLTALRRWSQVRALVSDRRRLLVLAGAGFLIAVNWLVFVYGVNSGHVVETSLGYFINPLVSVLLGVVVFAERLRPLQWVAVGIAAVAVVVLTVDYGRPPWIALGLAASFGLYGVMKKLVRVEAAPGSSWRRRWSRCPRPSSSRCCTPTGPAPSAPRAPATRCSWRPRGSPPRSRCCCSRRRPDGSRCPPSGLLQYLTPLMQLAIGVFVYGEEMPPARLAGFVIVWAALAVFTADSLRHARTTTRRTSDDAVPAGL